MRKIDQLFAEYAESHRNATNKTIHWICVPTIYFCVVGLLWSIPSPFGTGFLSTGGVAKIVVVLVEYGRAGTEVLIKEEIRLRRDRRNQFGLERRRLLDA